MVTATYPASGINHEWRKQTGAYYTPRSLTDFLASWVMSAGPNRILEPSVGTGEFLIALEQLVQSDRGPRVLAVDQDPKAVAHAAMSVDTSRLSVDFVVRNFFHLLPEETSPVQAVIGNPPWIRFHRFTGDDREAAALRAGEAGVQLTGLASSWAAFLVHAVSFLTPDGRVAMVLPGELLRADYAAPVRIFLAKRFRSIQLITFDLPVFPGAQVDTVLLLGSSNGPRGTWMSRLRGVDELAKFREFERPVVDARWGGASAEVGEALRELEESGQYVTLGSLGRVDIGVVTGHN